MNISVLYSSPQHFQSLGRMSCGTDCGSSFSLWQAASTKTQKTEHTNSNKMVETNVTTKNKRTIYHVQCLFSRCFCCSFWLFLYSVLVISLHFFSGLSCFVPLVLYGYGFSMCQSFSYIFSQALKNPQKSFTKAYSLN